MINNNTLWAITEGEMQNFSHGMKTAQANLKLEDFFNGRRPLEINDGIAVIDVRGALLNNAPRVSEVVGNTDYKSIISEIEVARVAGAKAYIFLFNSGGGSVGGLKEASLAIESIDVPKVAYVDTMACSAAYYLACSCDSIIASPSAITANVGTILVFQDANKIWESMGVKTEIFTNDGADLKSTFRESVTDSQREFLQGQVNELGEEFQNHVRSNRPDINEEVWRAGWYSGEKSGQLGIIDGLGTYADTITAIKPFI